MPHNILLVWDRMGDYHRARVKAVEEIMGSSSIFTADLGNADNLYHWGSTVTRNHFCLSTRAAHRFDFQRLINFVRLLSEKKIDAVCIAGYGRLEYLFFLIYSKLRGKKVILFAESWYQSSTLTDMIKSGFLRMVGDGFLVSGQRAFDHFTKRLRIPVMKVKIGYSVVDNAHFALKHSKSSDRKKILLCIARFASEKNLTFLINGFGESRMPQEGWELHLVGGGPQKDELLGRIARTKNPSLKLVDWQSYEQLPELYNEAVMFVLPSIFEPWGLVVNEAMAASLPLLLSDRVGSVPDLLKEGKNGWAFNTENRSEFLERLNRISVMTLNQLAEMGKQSEQQIASFSTTLFASNLRDLIQSSLGV
jgi:1,2-diacylglycerol 3-alpha-glucosyltransferase